jgi:hypothetical protein
LGEIVIFGEKLSQIVPLQIFPHLVIRIPGPITRFDLEIGSGVPVIRRGDDA